MEKYQLHCSCTQQGFQNAAHHWACCTHDWWFTYHSQKVTVSQCEQGFAAPCFPKEKAYHGFPKITAVPWEGNYIFFEDIIRVSSPNAAVSLGFSSSSRFGTQACPWDDLGQSCLLGLWMDGKQMISHILQASSKVQK